MAKSVDDRGRGARLARRDEGAYCGYVTEEQRSQPGCIGREGERLCHSLALSPVRGRSASWTPRRVLHSLLISRANRHLTGHTSSHEFWIQAGTAHFPVGHIVHWPSKNPRHSSVYLHCRLEVGQFQAHLLFTQSKPAQLPSTHGVQMGGGVPQSIDVWHLFWLQLGGPG
jgi:hypothetical protein